MSHDTFVGDYGTKLVPFDFNGDGKTDLAFSRPLVDASDNFTGYQYAIWTSNGLATPTQAIIGTVSPEWSSTLALADFDGNGTTDLLFNRTLLDATNNFAGYQYAVWTINGTQVTGQSVLGTRGVDWNSSGELGDFDGNGSFDLSFYKDTYDANNNLTGRQWAVWNTNGTSAPTKAVLGTTGADWYLYDLADFDGNGTSDMLFGKSTYGTDGSFTGEQFAVWTVNGTQVTGQAVLGSIGTDWYYDDLADFDGNGTSDMLFSKSTYGTDGSYTGEQYAVWTVNGGKIAGQAVIGSTNANWGYYDDLSDFNGDGTTDLLFSRNTSDASGNFSGYQFAVWTLNGTNAAGQAVIGSTNADWGYYDDLNDFNGDGSTDLLFSKSTFDANNNYTGEQYAVWLLNGTNAPVQKVIGSAGADWELVGSADVNGDGIADLGFVNSTTLQAAVWSLGADGSVTSQAVIGTLDNPTAPAGWFPIGGEELRA